MNIVFTLHAIHATFFIATSATDSFFLHFFRGSHEWSTPAVTQIVSMLPTLRTLGARHMALGMTARHMSKTVGIVTEKPFAAAAVEGIEDVFNEDFRG